jgi:hypothetical protein
MIAASVYVLGIIVALACGLLLLRGYFRGRQRLLLWSSICFLGLAISNFFVFADLVLFPNINFYPWRLGTAAVAMLCLLFGLIWEGE